jgi:hypothetical protein
LYALCQGFYLDIALFDRILVDFELIWHCERFRVGRHRLIDALAALNVSIGIPIRDLCGLKK